MPRMVLATGLPGHARHNGSSPIAEWLRGPGHRWFQEVSRDSDILPGDLIGVRFGRAIHHVAIVLTSGRYVHALEGHGVVISPVMPAPLLRRVAAMWRVRP